MKVTRANARGGRPKAARKPARGESRSAREPQRVFGRRKPPSYFSRAIESIRGWIGFRRPMLLITAALVLLTLIVVVISGGYIQRSWTNTGKAIAALESGAGFSIANIPISGNVRTPPETITAVLGFEPGQPIFGADLRYAREKLMRLPWIADAEVTRRYPDLITVSVVEKLPFALWQDQNRQVFVIERDGKLITNEGVRQFAMMPHLAGAGAPQHAYEIVDAVAQFRAVSARVVGFEYVSNRRWNLLLDDKVVVKLPESGWQKELAFLDRLIIEKGVLEHDIKEIDLRSKSLVFFSLKNGDQKSQVRGDKI